MNKKFLIVFSLLVFTKTTNTIDYARNAAIDTFAVGLQTIAKTSTKNKPQLPSRKTVNFPEKLAQEKYDQLRAVLKSDEGKTLSDFLKNKDKNAQDLRHSLGSSDKDITALWDIFSKSPTSKKPENILKKFDNDALIKLSQAIASQDSEGNLKKFIEIIKILNKPSRDFQDEIKVKNFDKQWPFNTIKTIETTELLGELKKAIQNKDKTLLIKIFRQIDDLFGALLEKQTLLQELLLHIKDETTLENLLKNSSIRDIYKNATKENSSSYKFIFATSKLKQAFLSNNPILLQFLLVKDTYPQDNFTDQMYEAILQRLMDLKSNQQNKLKEALQYIQSQLSTITSPSSPSRFIAIQEMKKNFPFQETSKEKKELENADLVLADLLKNNEKAKKLFERKELDAIKKRLLERPVLTKTLINCKECIDLMNGFDKDKLDSVATEIEFGLWDNYSAQEITAALKNIQEW